MNLSSSMKKHKILFLIGLTVMVYSLFTSSCVNSIQYTDYVDPLIGSDDHGHVFVGANVPFGFVQLGPSHIPDTILFGWDWSSGYHYTSDSIAGFTHTHFSGTGVGDLEDILLMPTGEHLMGYNNTYLNVQDYASSFSHQNEKVSPGYYKLFLSDSDITAELTATKRVGFHKYTYSKSRPTIALDLSHGNIRDSTVKTELRKLDDRTLIGFRYSSGFIRDHRVYFAIQFSESIDSMRIFEKDEANSPEITQAIIRFQENSKDIIKVKVGISSVSSANALRNIEDELPGWDFEATVENAKKDWNRELGKLKIKAHDKIMKVFYTGLYHTMIVPSIYQDTNGEYLSSDKKISNAKDYTNYTLFSLWDTYRGWHSLATLIHSEKVNDFVNSFLSIYEEQGKLPVWHLMSNETDIMVGYPAVTVIAEAYLKGFRDYNVDLAYEAVKHSANQDTFGIKYIKDLKFIPSDQITFSVSRALEYAYSDWCIAQMAKEMNNQKDYDYFMERSNLYKLYFDKSENFMRGLNNNGKWKEPFNPVVTNDWKSFIEGNSWQYTWLVPHDVEGLIELFQGRENFETKLDNLFNSKETITSGPLDVSGLIGMYSQGNEPGHHIPYLYSYINRTGKTADIIKTVDEKFYTDKPNGICGNEDCGEMSAWYIFSALGFYPLNPANGKYYFGTPLVESANITLDNNKKLKISTKDLSDNNRYIQRIELNGQALNRVYITHDELKKGGTLTYYMGNNKNYFNDNILPNTAR